MVARHFGAPGIVAIIKNSQAGLDEKFYSGKFTLLAKLSPKENRLMCLAGTVAEQIEYCADVDGGTLIELLLGGGITLSETDAAGAVGYESHDVAECLALVKSVWPKIVAAAEARISLEGREDVSDAELIACLGDRQFLQSSQRGRPD